MGAWGSATIARTRSRRLRGWGNLPLGWRRQSSDQQPRLLSARPIVPRCSAIVAIAGFLTSPRSGWLFRGFRGSGPTRLRRASV